MAKALLIVNREKPEAARTADSIRSVIARHAEVAEIDAGDEPLAPSVAFDVAVVVGGDGTLIAQTRRLVNHGKPIVGVNAGRLGFLAEFDAADLETHAALVFSAKPPIRERMLLSVEVEHASGQRETGSAINDAVITAGSPHRMIELALTVDDDDAGVDIIGDGVIVATPTGSTAYRRHHHHSDLRAEPCVPAGRRAGARDGGALDAPRERGNLRRARRTAPHPARPGRHGAAEGARAEGALRRESVEPLLGCAPREDAMGSATVVPSVDPLIRHPRDGEGQRRRAAP